MKGKSTYYTLSIIMLMFIAFQVNGQLVQPDNFTISQNNSQVLDVRSNDSYAINHFKTVKYTNTLGQEVFSPLHGSITIINNFTILYTPVNGYSGTDSFVYGIAQNDKLSVIIDTARVYINILSTDSVHCQAKLIFSLNTDNNEVSFHGLNMNNIPGNVISYHWDFGDTTSCNIENPIHNFPQGTRLVCLRINTSLGCTSTYCDSVIIPDRNCNANFNYSHINCLNCYQFTDDSGGNTLEWNWNFGDGTHSVLQNPNHTYPDSGHYQTCLTILGTHNCTSTICKDVYVPYHNYVPNFCNASFTYKRDTNSNCNFCYNFFDYSSGNVNYWKWDFGDGDTSNIQNPSHTFLTSGTYNICLKIFSANSCIQTYCQQIIILPPPTCTASFSATLTTNLNEYLFEDLSLNTVVQRIWDFGDGDSSTLQNPHHTYHAAGMYNVCLTIITSSGCTDSYCQQIQITPPQMCQANFSFNQNPSSLELNFQNISEGNINYTFWSFGDNDTTYTPNPSHTYLAAGVYNVCLVISTTDDCFSLTCQPVQVNDPGICQAEFSFLPSQDNSLSFTFNNNSTGNNISSLWKFGDGDSAITTSPNHLFVDSGLYNVCLIIKANNCSSSVCHEINVIKPSGAKSIGGYIWAGNQKYNKKGVVLLFKVDSAMHAVAWEYITDDSFWEFSGLSGKYLVYAIPLLHVNNPDKMYFPTYLGNALFWANADTLNTSSLPDTMDIHLIAGDMLPPYYGNGSISGEIHHTCDSTYEEVIYDQDWSETENNNAKTGNGSSARNMPVLLLNENNNPIKFILSNQTGLFSFNNLTNNNYKIYTEKAGLQTYPVTVSISPTIQITENIVINIGKTSITAIDPEFELNDIQKSLAIFPLPVKDIINISVNVTNNTSITIRISNALGQNIIQKQTNLSDGINKISFDLRSLCSGVYFLEFISENGQVISRKIIK